MSERGRDLCPQPVCLRLRPRRRLPRWSERLRCERRPAWPPPAPPPWACRWTRGRPSSLLPTTKQRGYDREGDAAVVMATPQRLTPRLEDVGELTDPLQQLPVGDRQLVSRLVAFPGREEELSNTHTHSCRHSHLHSHTSSNTHKHRFTLTQTHTLTQTYTNTDLQTLTHGHTSSDTHTNTSSHKTLTPDL